METRTSKQIDMDIGKNVITLQDVFNESKTMQFKQSKCSHFYYRQLIDGHAITNWLRAPKRHVKFIFNNYYKGTIWQWTATN